MGYITFMKRATQPQCNPLRVFFRDLADQTDVLVMLVISLLQKPLPELGLHL